ncbi:carbamoyltransferase [Prescottella equi]|uniref:Carbamoyltransferase n=1 Tax=Prescottella equi ATCC 33707 TaxID=525370 RepID=F1TJE7_RHOHA|nr:carbamoyltransferase C-terminal domain-containing protein [Prescottella equi]EGD24484.1 Carbamoyltransferase [Prescottella equi ATCC 33707]
MKILGVNAVFHDPAAAVVDDGRVITAAEEERFSRRKHGKRPYAFSTWEIPEQSIRWCLAEAGLTAQDLDAVTYSYDPALVDPELPGTEQDWEFLRTMYAERFPRFLRTVLPDVDPSIVRFVPHHLTHAASAALASPHQDCAVLVADGRGESSSYLAGEFRDGKLTQLASQSLPHSLGLMYEDLTEHLGFARSSDEYKVMALGAYGTPRFLPELQRLVTTTDSGSFRIEPIEWDALAPRRRAGDGWTSAQADLACSVQRRLEDVLLELAHWLYDRTGNPHLALAGGVALNCVANTRLHAEGPFDDVWVQPASGDAGTALGGALLAATELGDTPAHPAGYDLGRAWTDTELEDILVAAAVPYERPKDIADAVAEAIARNQVVGWFQGRSEFGPRALGHRSLLAHPSPAANIERLNAVKGREQFRPVAPMVAVDRASDIFGRGPVPSPYMLFVHDVAPEWRDRLSAVTHVDGTARIQTVDPVTEPLLHRMLAAFERRTGVPVVVNTSFNTAGRPMVDSPRDALECFGSAPIDLLAMGPFAVRRPR